MPIVLSILFVVSGYLISKQRKLERKVNQLDHMVKLIDQDIEDGKTAAENLAVMLLAEKELNVMFESKRAGKDNTSN